uniref:Phospholipase A2-like domain-containing protein n=1 Tax=Cacopsylla melanoneura TaxID=428564 RepID=A0A8D8WN81_9HEMI
MKYKRGQGLLNKLIDKLPVELHLPTYRFCGPGTKLQQRLHQDGINPLDSACKEHDIQYSNPSSNRKEADWQLENAAWRRVLAKDSSLPEKSAAWFVTNAMKVKRKMGAGMRKNKKKVFSFRKLTNAATVGMKTAPNKENIKSLAKFALLAAKKVSRGKIFNNKIPRVLKVPSTVSGGFLPAAIPILAGLSALGSLAGGVSGIAKAIADFRAVSNSGSITPIKSGQGLYIKPYRNGYGIISKN